MLQLSAPIFIFLSYIVLPIFFFHLLILLTFLYLSKFDHAYLFFLFPYFLIHYIDLMVLINFPAIQECLPFCFFVYIYGCVSVFFVDNGEAVDSVSSPAGTSAVISVYLHYLYLLCSTYNVPYLCRGISFSGFHLFIYWLVCCFTSHKQWKLGICFLSFLSIVDLCSLILLYFCLYDKFVPFWSTLSFPISYLFLIHNLYDNEICFYLLF